MKHDLNEKIDEYLYKIMKCKPEWPASDHAGFSRFVLNISFRFETEIGTHIITWKHTNFDELFRKAKEIENLIKKRDESSSSA